MTPRLASFILNMSLVLGVPLIMLFMEKVRVRGWKLFAIGFIMFSALIITYVVLSDKPYSPNTHVDQADVVQKDDGSLFSIYDLSSPLNPAWTPFYLPNAK